MIQDKNGVLQPFNFENLLSYIPMLKDFPADISSYSFETARGVRGAATGGVRGRRGRNEPAMGGDRGRQSPRRL